MTRALLSLFVFGAFAHMALAQQGASMRVTVEIIRPTLTLSVSSARLDFGQVPPAGRVELHPETGTREGEAYGSHSVAGILLTGPQGTPVTVQVLPPTPFSSPTDSPLRPTYEMRWAQSHECTQTAFAQLPDTDIIEGEIGVSGCTQLRFGGVLTANQAPPGRYAGEMTVRITQL